MTFLHILLDVHNCILQGRLVQRTPVLQQADHQEVGSCMYMARMNNLYVIIGL